MKSFSDIPKFGFVIGLLSALFKLCKCIFNRPLFANIDQRVKVFISGMIASLALRLATSSEVTMVKLLLYPRVIECIFQYLCEKGLIKKFKHGDIFAYAAQVVMITASFIFEQDNLTPGFVRTIGTYSDRLHDLEAYQTQAAKVRAGVHRKHG